MVGHGAWEPAKCPKQGGGVAPGNGKRFQQSRKGNNKGGKGGGKGGDNGDKPWART